MKIRKLFYRMIALMSTVVLTAGVPVAGAAAKTVKTTVKAGTLQNGLQFTLTGMPYNGKYSPIPRTYNHAELEFSSVQNFAFSPDNRYIFTVSEGRSSGKKHTILVCSKLPSSRGVNAKATYKAYAILDNYGHGETIAVTGASVSGADYDIWVACTPYKSNGLGRDIMRLSCRISGSKINIVKKVKLSFAGVKPCNKSVTRDRLGVAVNPASGKIAFRIHTTKHGTFYQVYDFAKLNQKISAVKNNGTFKMSSKAAKNLLQANIQCNLTPHNTFQSFDVDKNYLYICGGHMNKGAMVYKIQYKSYKNGKSKAQILKEKNIAQKITITPKIKAAGKTLGKADLEIEGLKIQAAGKKINYYINFYMKKVSIKDTLGIYKFTK